MNPLIFSLVCLVLVGISANLLKLIKENKILLYISLIPCVYLLLYGIYLIFGPIDLYEDGTKNFILENPKETNIPTVFLLLKFYQYILFIVGGIFSYLFFKYLIRKKI